MKKHQVEEGFNSKMEQKELRKTEKKKKNMLVLMSMKAKIQEQWANNNKDHKQELQEREKGHTNE